MENGKVKVSITRLMGVLALLGLLAGCHNDLTVTATFDKVGQLKGGDEVHFKGSAIGKVRTVTLNKEGAFEVVMAIGRNFAAGVKEDSTFSVDDGKVVVGEGTADSPSIKSGAVVKGASRSTAEEPSQRAKAAAPPAPKAASKSKIARARPRPAKPLVRKQFVGAQKNPGMVPAGIIRWKYARLLERAKESKHMPTEKMETARANILKELNTIEPKLPEYGIKDDAFFKATARAIRRELEPSQSVPTAP